MVKINCQVPDCPNEAVIRIRGEGVLKNVCSSCFMDILPNTLPDLIEALNPEGKAFLLANQIKEIIPAIQVQITHPIDDFLLTRIMAYMKKNILIKDTPSKSEWVLTLLDSLWNDSKWNDKIVAKFKDEKTLKKEITNIYETLPDLLQTISPTDKPLLKVNLNTTLVAQPYGKFIWETKGFGKKNKFFVIHKEAFLADYMQNFASGSQGAGIGSGTGSGGIGYTMQLPTSSVQNVAFKDIIERSWKCGEIFPDLSGVYKHYDSCLAFMRSQGVWMKESILRKMLLAVERDTPFILYGEPGDGKSNIAKNFLRWLTIIYNGGRDDENASSNFQIPLNKNLNKVIPDEKAKGISYLTKNIDESTSATTLYGGFSPEIIVNPNGDRRDKIDYGLFSRGIMEGKYILADELNRTDNETLGRMMGFLADPYNYDISEAKERFFFKIGKQRSNFIIIGTMNVGDVGNFKMSFAFKRRFKIIKLHYTFEEIGEIAKYVYGFGTYTDPTINANIQVALGNITPPNILIDDYIQKDLNKFVAEFSINLFDETHKWSKAQNVAFGVGVGHIKSVLEDLSLFIIEIMTRKGNKDMLIKTLSDIVSPKVDPPLVMGNSNPIMIQIRTAVEDCIDEDVIMAIIDENDSFKLEKLTPQIVLLKNALFVRVESLIKTYIGTYVDKKFYNLPLSDPQFIKAMGYIFKFNKSKKELTSGDFNF